MLIKYALVVALALGLVYTAMAAGTSSKSTPRKAGDYELGGKAVKAANYGKALSPHYPDKFDISCGDNMILL